MVMKKATSEMLKMISSELLFTEFCFSFSVNKCLSLAT